jgi:predicted PurR-regulated permease PerM
MSTQSLLSTPRRRNDPVRLIAVAISLVAIAVIVLWGLYLARTALLLIYVSTLLAIGFGPLVHMIEHQRRVPVGSPRLPRWLAILVVYLVVVGALIVTGILIIPPLVSQAADLWTQLPEYLDRVQTFLIDRGFLTHTITLEEAVRRAPGSPRSAVGTVASAFTWTVTTMLGVLTVVVLTFYLLVESNALLAGFVRLFPRDTRPRVVEASRKVSAKVSAWLNGQLILAATIGVTGAVALYFLGVPYFYVLALIAGVGEMVPVIGPVLSAVPAILVALTVSPRTALLVAIFWVAQQQVENHLLVPRIMARQVGVSPVVVVVALLVGGSLLGILGAVLAVPTAAILQVVVQELLDERDRQLDAGNSQADTDDTDEGRMNESPRS